MCLRSFDMFISTSTTIRALPFLIECANLFFITEMKKNTEINYLCSIDYKALIVQKVVISYITNMSAS